MKTPFGTKPAVGIDETTKFAAGVQMQERAGSLAQLSVRDSALKMMQAADATMGLMVDKDGKDTLPGASSSLFYAQTKQKQISAQHQLWKENDLGGYDTDAMRLQNQERRYDVNPYSPGNRMELELKGLGMDKKRIAELQHRESYLKSKGMLSEQAEFEFESQIEGLTTNRQERIGHLVDGVANRLPSMMAGRAGFAGRIDSRQMTAMQFGMIGFPYRGAGALNSKQLGQQEHFLEQFLSPDEIGSRSRTTGINTRTTAAGGAGSGMTHSPSAVSGSPADGKRVAAGVVVNPTSKSGESPLHFDQDKIAKYHDQGKEYTETDNGTLVDRQGRVIGHADKKSPTTSIPGSFSAPAPPPQQRAGVLGGEFNKAVIDSNSAGTIKYGEAQVELLTKILGELKTGKLGGNLPSPNGGMNQAYRLGGAPRP
jgi:hypothetical protein